MTTAIDVKKGGIRALLSTPTVLAQLRKALPRSLPAETFARQAITLFNKQPKLAACSEFSIMAGLMEAAQLGLELTGPLGHAWLVPRWNGKKKENEATFQIGYKGLIKLAQQSGHICELPARVVYANDDFAVRLGTNHEIKHDPAVGDRGEPAHYYAIAFYQNNRFDFECWDMAQMQAHRMRYSPPSDRPSAWDSAFDAMAKKTVIRALCGRLSLAPRAQIASYLDDCYERGIDPYAEKSREALPRGSRAMEVLEHLDAATGVAEEAVGAGSSAVMEGQP